MIAGSGGVSSAPPLRDFHADRDLNQNITAAIMAPMTTAASTMAPVSPSDPISTFASPDRPVVSCGGEMILTMTGPCGGAA